MDTVVLRAKLTADEWRAVRKLALDRNVSVPFLVGEAIRASLLKGAKP